MKPHCILSRLVTCFPFVTPSFSHFDAGYLKCLIKHSADSSCGDAYCSYKPDIMCRERCRRSRVHTSQRITIAIFHKGSVLWLWEINLNFLFSQPLQWKLMEFCSLSWLYSDRSSEWFWRKEIVSMRRLGTYICRFCRENSLSLIFNIRKGWGES